MSFFFFQAEDGIRDLVRSRGLGDVYKRQVGTIAGCMVVDGEINRKDPVRLIRDGIVVHQGRLASLKRCLLYTSDAADERSSVDLGGRRIIKKKKKK